jgi:5-methylcytosine-specific restriction endonuclease McrA
MFRKGDKHTQEWKDNLSKRMTGHKSFFPDGYVAWNKGKKGCVNSGSFRKGHKVGMTGKHHSEETRKKIAQSNTGHKCLEETKEKLRLSHLGKRIGINNNRWKGGITPINKKIRNSVEYKLWRKAVFERDKYTCIWCGKRGGRLNADHIKRFSDFPELRFAIDNGRTLCKSCHSKTDNFGTKGYKKNK